MEAMGEDAQLLETAADGRTASDEDCDPWGDGDSAHSGDADGTALRAAACQLQQQEMRALETKLANIGYERGIEETYLSESQRTEDAFDAGLVEGFSRALVAGRLLGELRLVPAPRADLVETLYRQVKSRAFDEIDHKTLSEQARW